MAEMYWAYWKKNLESYEIEQVIDEVRPLIIRNDEDSDESDSESDSDDTCP